MLEIIYFLFAFGALAAMAWSGLKLLEPQEDPLGDRLDELQAHAMISTTQRGTKRRAGGGFFNNFLFALSSIGLEDYLRDIEKELTSSGVRRKNALALYMLFQIGFFVALVSGMLYLQRDNEWSNKLGGLAAAMILGYLIPQQFLHRFGKRYRLRLQQALPDTVDLLGIVLGTGLALDQAMTRVSEEMQYIYPELASEFYTVVMQVKAGQERGKAFSALVRRTGIEDIKSLAAMIIQSEKFGTSLSNALKVYADALRLRRRLRAEEAAGKVAIKMTIPIVIFILPVLFVVSLVPGVAISLRGLAGGIGAK